MLAPLLSLETKHLQIPETIINMATIINMTTILLFHLKQKMLR